MIIDNIKKEKSRELGTTKKLDSNNYIMFSLFGGIH